MEKKRPHYSLQTIKSQIQQGNYRATRTALQSAREDFRLLDSGQLAAVVLALRADSFYKSMTTLHDAKIWQDVYHGRIGDNDAYIKLQVLDDLTVIISFKRL